LGMPKSLEMPFTAKPVQPGAKAALNRANAAGKAMRDYEAARAEQAVIRAEAIREANRLGLTLDAIADGMGVTKGRVQQYLKAAGKRSSSSGALGRVSVDRPGGI
jgi:hypothetical protein